MKFVCEQCEETVAAASIKIDDGQIALECPECGETTTSAVGVAEEPDSAPEIETPSEPESEREPEPEPEPESEETEPAADSADDSVVCPKCLTRQSKVDHCRICGLDLNRLEELGLDWDASPEGKEVEFKKAMEIWVRLERNIRSTEIHEAFVTHCTESGLLELAVRRYRTRHLDFPDEPVAERFGSLAIERMEKLALTMLATEQWSVDLQQQVHIAKRVLILIAALLLIFGLILMFIMYQKTGSFMPSAI
jgi:hypothetical protein